MNLIQNNPYRTVGLLVGATAKEQTKQIKKLKMFLEAEQEPQDDFSFPTLGNLNRTLESVEEAASKLNLDSDKINAALFWFWNGNPITDEAAFDALKSGDTDNAIEIWQKLTENAEEITKRNASAFHNLSTLYLSEYGIDEDTLQLKLRFLESDFVKEFKAQATDETFKVTKKELQLLFLENLSQDEDFDISEFFEAVSDIDFSAKQDFMKGFVQKSISQIEQQIETAKSKRKSNKANAINAGKELYNAVATEINQLKSILGTSDIKFSSISDKVAEELLQCGIDYFKHYRDSNTDPSSYSMDLFRKAKNFAIGSVAKQRIQENTENLQEWIDDKPERDKQKKVEEDLKFITSKLERFQNLFDTISNAKDLVDSCKPKLVNIKNTLGSTDDFYLKISGAVVNNAQGMLVTVINDEQELFQLSTNPSSANIQKIAEIAVRRNGANRANATSAFTDLITDRYTAIANLKTAIRGAVDVSTSLGTLDMVSELRTRYNKNHSTLKSIASQLGVGSSSYSSSSSSSSTRTSPTYSSSSSSGSSWAEENPGCLIALIIGAIIFLISIFS